MWNWILGAVSGYQQLDPLNSSSGQSTSVNDEQSSTPARGTMNTSNALSKNQDEDPETIRKRIPHSLQQESSDTLIA